MEGIANLGGARIDLQGGHYLVSRPLRFPATGAGNVLVCFNLSFSMFIFSLKIFLSCLLVVRVFMEIVVC